MPKSHFGRKEGGGGAKSAWKGKAVTDTRKPKHSKDANRPSKSTMGQRTASTVSSIEMRRRIFAAAFSSFHLVLMHALLNDRRFVVSTCTTSALRETRPASSFIKTCSPKISHPLASSLIEDGLATLESSAKSSLTSSGAR